MYQLNYRSRAIPDIEIKDLEAILETSINVNSINNITGCLIFHKGNFVQVLEGRKKDVLRIYDKIKTDQRHNKVTLLWENKVGNRVFSEWNMAYYRPENQNQQQFVNNLLLLSELSDHSSGTLLSFWGTVRKILLDGSLSPYENLE